MNRRDFLKMMGVAALLPVVPNILIEEKDNMRTLSELLLQIADGQPLSGLDRESLRQHAMRIEDVSMVAKSWQGVDGKIKNEYLDLPMRTISSIVFPEDTAEWTVQIPSIYNNILIEGNGAVVSASGGSVYAQFNGDTGSNYNYTYLQGNGTSALSGKVASATRLIIGQFSNAGDPSESASPFSAKIINANSNLHKTVISLTEYDDGTSYSVYLIGGKWKNSSGINEITIYGADGTGVKGSTDIKAGSKINVYGFI